MSLLWPDVTQPAGQNSAAARGFWAALLVGFLAFFGPPPLGILNTGIFLLIAAGIRGGQAWAARAGVIAAYAPLLINLGAGPGMIGGIFVQCSIVAFFLFQAWRGLRERAGTGWTASAIGWLALSIGYLFVVWYTGTGLYLVPDNSLSPLLTSGDRVIVRPLDSAPQAGQIVAYRAANDAPGVNLGRITAVRGDTVTVDPGAREVEVRSIAGRPRWIAWSDGAGPTDSPLAFYAKAKWGRFPRPLH